MPAIGVDIIETERVARSVARFGDRFLKRVFTERELAYCNGRTACLAARWAAKEAVGKALGTGIGDVGWREIEIVNSANKCPSVQLHGAAARLAIRRHISGFAISISHTRDYAVAFVTSQA